MNYEWHGRILSNEELHRQWAAALDEEYTFEVPKFGTDQQESAFPMIIDGDWRYCTVNEHARLQHAAIRCATHDRLYGSDLCGAASDGCVQRMFYRLPTTGARARFTVTDRRAVQNLFRVPYNGA